MYRILFITEALFGCVILVLLLMVIVPVRVRYLLYAIVRAAIPSIRKSSRLLAKIPSYKGHWLYGNYFDRQKKGYQKELAEWAIKNNHKLSIEWLTPAVPCVNIHCPHLLMNTANSPRNGKMYCAATTWIGKPTAFASGKSRVQKRKLLSDVFESELVKSSFIPVFTECSDILISKWNEQATSMVFVHDEVSKLITDVLLRCNFSKRQSECPAYAQAIERVKDSVFSRLGLSTVLEEFRYHYLTLSGWKTQRNSKLIHRQTMNFIKQHEKDSQKGTDILDAVMNHHEFKMDRLEVQNEMDSFMFWGLHSTSSTISWALYYLARDQTLQGKCRREISETLGTRSIYWEQDITKLQKISWVIKETMRFHPTMTELFRTIPTDTVLADHLIPKQTTICYKVLSIHFDPKVWTNPYEFNPSRFDPSLMSDLHPYAFLPFSISPRNCPAEEFAMNLMTVVVALIIRSFTVSLQDDSTSKENEGSVKELVLSLKSRP